MPRTRLFTLSRRALARARAALPGATLAERAVTRRAALLMTTGMALAACAPKRPPEQPASDAGQTVVVGAGVSGLLVAWRLASAGRDVALYESSGRAGGRMFTQRDFTHEGQFCELGGELVDTNHDRLIGLCNELGLPLQRLRAEDDVATDLYDFGGKVYSTRDLLDHEAQTGAFIPVAARIAADQADLLDSDDNWTPRALELDALPLSTYLDSLRPTAPAWVIDFLAVAYQGEYGLPTSRQSSLNLVDYIGTDVSSPFAVFGDSDEAMRIAGGSSTLPDTLLARLEEPALAQRASIHYRHALTAIRRDAMGFRLDFATPAGVRAVRSSRVVFALPFTRLREVEGLGGLGFSAGKMQAINELGYGANAKLMVATKARPWRDAALFRLNTPSTGSVYSDRGFQQIWDTSAGQPGEGGVLTNFMGAEATEADETMALERLQAGLRGLSPRLADTLTPETRASFFWPRHPHTLASYSAARPGQYTGLFEHAAATELEGACFFAGEHASVDGYGFMNGAVDAGERVATEILA